MVGSFCLYFVTEMSEHEYAGILVTEGVYIGPVFPRFAKRFLLKVMYIENR